MFQKELIPTYLTLCRITLGYLRYAHGTYCPKREIGIITYRVWKGKMDEDAGVEPASQVSGTWVRPLYQSSMAGAEGVEPSLPVSKTVLQTATTYPKRW